MNNSPAIEFTFLSGLALLCMIFLVAWCLYRTSPFIRITSDIQQRCLGIAVALLPLWLLKAGLHPGLEMHFLGLSVATLMVGWHLSLLVGVANLILLGIWQGSSPAQLTIEALLGVALPIAVTMGVLTGYRRYLPQHFFIYIFVCGFFGAALAMLGRHLALGLFYLVDGQYRASAVTEDYLYLWPLLLFPEALLNGMAVTLMATYRPQWLASFKYKELN
ncbi:MULTISPECIES: energy-coupling factor ABC transporter permease [unclassified Motilimonas]|uniref:energy-coupling factor ABC transporter permease n=1 Tax=unclassified Motilimonas TaxID=2643697 RepID=UPI001E29EF76|nr:MULTISPECIES: energy-coupling factor ABC transporter permease [unclassified Motilimonas]MCE0556823.1 energy-coupling factor ABC transporter permease [Motilimonas sp. E26]MDO6525127.1 energy-coupling factor ABC transporter permease [Motilimonas sp. 1_MG-2023]